MASGSSDRAGSETESQELLPQITPDKGKGQKRMRGTAKASTASKKKPKENVEKAIPPEEAIPTEDQAIVSEDQPKKGGHRLETNTTAEMSDPEGYRTVPGETSVW